MTRDLLLLGLHLLGHRRVVDHPRGSSAGSPGDARPRRSRAEPALQHTTQRNTPLRAGSTSQTSGEEEPRLEEKDNVVLGPRLSVCI